MKLPISSLLCATVLITLPTQGETMKNDAKPEGPPKGKVLVILFSGFEYFETTVPTTRLLEEGYEAVFASNKRGELTGGHDLRVDATQALSEVKPEDYQGVLVPGGAEAGYPSEEVDLKNVSRIVGALAKQGKPVLGICMGVGVLARTGLLKDVEAACDSSTAKTLESHGGKLVQAPVVTDGPFTTSRFFPDLPHFCREMMSRLRRLRPLLMITGPGFKDLHVRGTF